MNPKPFKPVPPGDILRDEMEARGWTEGYLAHCTRLVREDARRALASEVDITPDIANALARAFDTSLEFWLNLQTKYDEDKKRKVDDGN